MRLNRHAVCLSLLAWSSSLIAAQAPPDSAPAQTSQPIQPQQATSPAASATSAASASATAPTSTAASPTIGTSPTTAAPAAAQAKTETAVVTDAATDKRLRSQGWKRKVVNGELVYCKEEQVLGTRFPKTVCGSAQALRDATRQSREWTEQMEQNIGNPSKRCPLCS